MQERSRFGCKVGRNSLKIVKKTAAASSFLRQPADVKPRGFAIYGIKLMAACVTSSKVVTALALAW